MNTPVKAPILSRADLSFTQCDERGRLVHWPRNNPGVATDWKKGSDFFSREVCELSAHNEAEAFNAIRFAITDMAARSTCLEIGFAEAVARAAIMGLRAIHAGATWYEPTGLEQQGGAQ